MAGCGPPISAPLIRTHRPITAFATPGITSAPRRRRPSTATRRMGSGYGRPGCGVSRKRTGVPALTHTPDASPDARRSAMTDRDLLEFLIEGLEVNLSCHDEAGTGTVKDL